MSAALAAGAAEVTPCLEIAEARERAATLTPGSYVLGGERHGVKIDGFDLGNSPAEYIPAIVRGKTVFITTTNGTRAMGACRPASRAFVASFTNVGATIAALANDANVHVVCAGTDGQVSADDVLLAGWLALGWRQATGAARGAFDDAAELAMAAAREIQAAVDPRAALEAALRASLGGRNLVALGFDRDILYAADVDRHPLAVKFDPGTLRIVGAEI
jgi:2-phosphosulfolactate phosphatase